MILKIVDAYRTAYADLPLSIWMLSAAIFVNRLGTMVLPFLTLYLTKSLGYSDSAAGFMISLYGVGSVIGAYLGGKLTKSVGAIRLQVILLLFSVPIFIALPFCESLIYLSLTILTLSIFTEGVRPANSTAITQFSSPEKRTRSFALNRMALNLGISFGPAIGGLLIAYSFFWIFIADALTTAACALLLVYFFGFSGGSAQTNEDTTSENKKENLPNQSPLKDINFLIYLSLIFVSAIVFFQFFTTYPLYLNEHYGLNEFQIGLVYAINTVMVVVLEMLLVEFIKNWNLILCVALGCFLTCIGFGLLPFGQSLWLCVFSMVVLTFGEMLNAPTSASWVSQRSESRDTGSYMGWYTMSYSLAFIAGPAIGGVLYEYNKATVWYLSIAVGFIVLIGFWLLNAKLQKEAALQSER